MKIVKNKLFEKIIYYAIILNLIAMVIESELNLDNKYWTFLENFELVSIIIFSIEYIIRSIDSFQKNKSYNRSFFGFIDLLSILPFFFQSTMGFDGRFIRVIRLFRISRILKLGKFHKSFELLWNGIYNVKKELYLTFYIAFIMLFFSATGIYYLENPQQPEEFSSIINSFWWSVASLTGVYFKDIYPITLGGKIFGTIISLIGVGVVAVPTGIISASFVDVINKSHKDK